MKEMIHNNLREGMVFDIRDHPSSSEKTAIARPENHTSLSYFSLFAKPSARYLAKTILSIIYYEEDY